MSKFIGFAIRSLTAMGFCLAGIVVRAQVNYGSLIFQDDFSTSNSVWMFKLENTHGNQTAIDNSIGRIKDGVLTVKGNVDCGWDYLVSIASLQMPLPRDYIIEYRARKLQWCGQFDAFFSQINPFPDPTALPVWPPFGFAYRMEGNWFNALTVNSTGTNVDANVPPASRSQVNGQWYNFRVIKRSRSIQVYVDDVLQWSYSGNIPPGGFLNFVGSAAGSTAEVDDLRIYEIGKALEIKVAAVRICWLAEFNVSYRVEWSSNHQTWSNLLTVVGTGSITNILDWNDGQRRFYRYRDLGEINLTKGLVGYYPFNGNANDESGNGNNANVVGASLGTNRFGIAANSYSFGSVNQYILTPNFAQLPISTNDFSVCIWAKFSAFPVAPMIFCNQSLGDFQCHLGLVDSQGSLTFQTGGGGRSGPYSDYCQGPAQDWTLNRWYNLQAVRSSNILTLYRDGSVVTQVYMSRGNEAPAPARALAFGFRPQDGQNQLYGQLDDIRIYNRALSEGEIEELNRLTE